MRLLALVFPLLLALVPACNGTGPAPRPAGRAILFVGGSLEEWNDMPGMVEALARSRGHDSVSIGRAFLGGSSLRDHWDEGSARRQIAGGGWDVVILGQGPSALPESRAELREEAVRWAALIRQHGGEPALHMTWPRLEHIANFPASSESWRLAAGDVNGILLAVGDAWQATWRRDSSIALYGDDGWHPAVNASYLAALVIAGKLFDERAAGMPTALTLRSGQQLRIDPDIAAVLQAAADEVNGR